MLKNRQKTKVTYIQQKFKSLNLAPGTKKKCPQLKKHPNIIIASETVSA